MFSIYIYGVIESCSENSALSISERVQSSKGDKIEVRLSSPGGDIYEAVAISNVLKAHPSGYTVVIDSIAASAASIIASEADEVLISPRAEVMIHNPWSSFAGDADSMIKQAGNLNRMAENMAKSYAEKTGYGDTDYWLGLMAEETWFSAEEAIDIGLADGYTEEKSNEDTKDAVVAAYALADFDYKYHSRKEAPSPATANAIEEKNMDDNFMVAIAAKLGMTEENLDQEMILAALDETLEEQETENTSSEVEENNTPEEETSETPVEENTTSEQEEENTSSENEEETKENTSSSEVDEETEENTSSSEVDEETEDNPKADTVVLDKDVYEDLQRRAALAEEVDKQQKEQEATNLVEEAIKDGKILPNKKKYLVAAALEDFEGMKAHFDSLASGVIPITETGRSKIAAEDTQSQNKELKDNLSNLFGLPRV